MEKEIIIDKDYLRKHPEKVFVFGDNTIREGYGGPAILRDEPNTYGFITKIKPDNEPSSFYTLNDYEEVYQEEIVKLQAEIENNPTKFFLISKVGAGLANRFGIFEGIIEKCMKNDLANYTNVKFLW